MTLRRVIALLVSLVAGVFGPFPLSDGYDPSGVAFVRLVNVDVGHTGAGGAVMVALPLLLLSSLAYMGGTYVVLRKWITASGRPAEPTPPAPEVGASPHPLHSSTILLPLISALAIIGMAVFLTQCGRRWVH